MNSDRTLRSVLLESSLRAEVRSCGHGPPVARGTGWPVHCSRLGQSCPGRYRTGGRPSSSCGRRSFVIGAACAIGLAIATGAGRTTGSGAKRKAGPESGPGLSCFADSLPPPNRGASSRWHVAREGRPLLTWGLPEPPGRRRELPSSRIHRRSSCSNHCSCCCSGYGGNGYDGNGSCGTSYGSSSNCTSSCHRNPSCNRCSRGHDRTERHWPSARRPRGRFQPARKRSRHPEQQCDSFSNPPKVLTGTVSGNHSKLPSTTPHLATGRPSGRDATYAPARIFPPSYQANPVWKVLPFRKNVAIAQVRPLHYQHKQPCQAACVKMHNLRSVRPVGQLRESC